MARARGETQQKSFPSRDTGESDSTRQGIGVPKSHRPHKHTDDLMGAPFSFFPRWYLATTQRRTRPQRGPRRPGSVPSVPTHLEPKSEPPRPWLGNHEHPFGSGHGRATQNTLLSPDPRDPTSRPVVSSGLTLSGSARQSGRREGVPCLHVLAAPLRQAREMVLNDTSPAGRRGHSGAGRGGDPESSRTSAGRGDRVAGPTDLSSVGVNGVTKRFVFKPRDRDRPGHRRQITRPKHS